MQAPRTITLLKRDSNTGFFLWNLRNFYKHLVLQNISRTSPAAASDSFRFPACNSIKKETPGKMFFCEFYKIFKSIFSFDRTPPDDCLLYLLWILKSFSERFFYKAPPGYCLFHVQVAEFQPLDAVKNYFIGAFQAFYTRTRSSHSKAFIYLKSLKTICEEVNPNITTIPVLSRQSRFLVYYPGVPDWINLSRFLDFQQKIVHSLYLSPAA